MTPFALSIGLGQERHVTRSGLVELSEGKLVAGGFPSLVCIWSTLGLYLSNVSEYWPEAFYHLFKEAVR